MQWFCYKRIIEGEFFSYMNGEVLGARYDWLYGNMLRHWQVKIVAFYRFWVCIAIGTWKQGTIEAISWSKANPWSGVHMILTSS